MIQISPLLPKIKPKRSEIQKFKSLIFHLPVNEKLLLELLFSGENAQSLVCH